MPPLIPTQQGFPSLQGFSDASGVPAARGSTDNLVDPITAKVHHIQTVPVDEILDYNVLDRVVHGFRTVFVTLPKTVYKGLRGDPDVSFSDYMLLGNIPYYVGGAALAFSFAAGRDKRGAIRQGFGVGFYYLGVLLANQLVNLLYRARYGVDLGMLYMKSDGRIEKVFASADFPRTDLLTPERYTKMKRKMGIPETIADPDQACREQLYRIINSSRAIKLLLGNTLAAIGAGYLARTDAWAHLSGASGLVKNAWLDSRNGGLWNRLNNTLLVLSSKIEPALKTQLQGVPGKTNWLPKVTLGALGIIAFLCLVESLNALKPKRFEATPDPILPIREAGTAPVSLSLGGVVG